jgi:hypothetical protein
MWKRVVRYKFANISGEFSAFIFRAQVPTLKKEQHFFQNIAKFVSDYTASVPTESQTHILKMFYILTLFQNKFSKYFTKFDVKLFRNISLKCPPFWVVLHLRAESKHFQHSLRTLILTAIH